MRKFIFFLLSVFALLIIVQVDVFACRCIIDPQQTLEQRINTSLKTAKAVFSGKVVEVSKIPNIEFQIVQIKVEESWKNSLPEEIEIATSSSNCGYGFETGKSYLVFADNSEVYGLSTSKCSSNRELENAAEELNILGVGLKEKIICPRISLSSQIEGLPKNTWIYTARLKNAEPNLKLTYLWEYHNGDKISEIKAGQGTSQITIENVNLFKGITVGVKIGGLPIGCRDWSKQSVVE